MPDDDLPAPEPPPPEQPTLLGGIAPDEMIARAMQTVKMTSGATGMWQPPSIKECARLFPGYEVLHLLGRGGMGAVYQARQIELDRLVAIKLLPLEVSVDKDFADRFRREARAMAKLNHPNIIAVHDFGTTREGHLFFVMEYVEGANLADIIHHGAVAGVSDPGYNLAPDQALSIAEQVCIALAYAHNKGIVHRDIKPANVMVDTESHVKVADFGLARLTDPGAEQLGHTMTGTVMGTPDYMAPEQCKGMNVDHRADIYSLGVMIYEMMCREVPKGIFDPPSHRTGCDARIDQIVIRAMQQSPERRYQSTQEMRNDITTARTPQEVPEVGTPRRGVQAAGGRRGAPSLPKPPKKPVVPKAPPKPPPSPETSVMQAVKPPAPAKKSKLPLYGGIGIGVAALAVAAFLFMRPEKLTKAQIYAREHAGEQGAVAGVNDPGPASMRPAAAPTASLPAVTKDAPFVNTLGMKFVPVPGTKAFFSIWDTRVQDYAAYAKANRVDDAWTSQAKNGVPVSRETDYPIVGVNWDDANAFCQWLTEKERAEGKLPQRMKYRLPTDEEWSCAIGMAKEEGATPAERSGKNGTDFPWGLGYPPPKAKVGNYADAAYHEKFPNEKNWIEGYTDGYAATSPVGSFAPNEYGLYDMGGNVWQWCEDLFEPRGAARVLRGASWNYGVRYALLSSYRLHNTPSLRDSNYGFRCVLASVGTADGGTRSAVSQAPPIATTPRLSPSSEPWVDAMNNSNLLKAAVKEGAALRATEACKGLYIDLGPELKDGAVRMLYTADASAIASCSVQVRRTSGSFYYLQMEPDFLHIGLGILENRVGRSLKSFRLPAEAVRPAGQPVELELRMVGTTLVAKANGFEAFRLEDSKLTQGHLGIRLDPGVLLHAVQTLDLSKGAAASAPVAPTANPNPVGWEKAVHLLPLIQPEKDAVAGVWKMVNGKLQSDTASNARLQIPYQPPEEYDYRLVFSYEETSRETKDGQVQQLLVKKDHAFQWVMGAPQGNNSAFEMIAGASASSAANPTRKARDPVLARSRPHTSIVEVRNEGLKAWLDGELAAEWKTDFHDLFANPNWKLPDARSLGVGSWHTAVLIEQIDVREVTGKGTLTRAAAAKAAATGSDGRAGARPSEAKDAPSPPTAEPGFRPLFDGKTLAGWRSYPSEDLPADWRVADGAILGGKRSFVVTKETFGDFELRLEWKMGPKGNGGIFFRMLPGEGSLPRTAPEFQLSAHDDPDKYKTGALYNVQVPSADASLPEGQWNTARLVAQGNHIEHWVNDRLVLSYELQSDDWKQRWKAGGFANVTGYAQAAQGWIGLQGWVADTAYRNIRIRTLTGPSAASSAPGEEKWNDGLAEWWEVHGKEKDVETRLKKEAGGSRLGEISSVAAWDTRRGQLSDVALRVVVSGVTTANLCLRTGDHNIRYRAGFYANGRGGIGLDLETGSAMMELKRFDLPPGFDVSGRHTAEFRVQGDTLTFLLDGREMASVHDTQRTTGGGYFFGNPGTLLEKLEYRELPSPGAR